MAVWTYRSCDCRKQKPLVAAIPTFQAIEKLAPGSGGLKIGALVNSNLKKTFIGGGLDYNHRIKDNLSVFTQITGGAVKTGQNWQPEVSASAGLQLKF